VESLLMSLDSSATQYASSMDVNLVRNVFVPSYTFDGSLGQFSVQLDTNLRGNVNVGDTTTNYSLKINGSIVQTVSTGYHWSTLPAIQTVDMNGYGLINISIGNAAGPQTLYYNPATESITYNPTFTLPPGSNWGEYLYWNGTTYSLGSSKILLGANAGLSGQQTNAIAIGVDAGRNNQTLDAIAIGHAAGRDNQQGNAIAIGQAAGRDNQQDNSIAIGQAAGISGQKVTAIAIGLQAGASNQGQNAIAIGVQAGYLNQISNSIILNATGNDFGNTGYRTVSGFYVAPVRSNVGPASVYYDSGTKEITYGPTVSSGLTIPVGSLYGDYLRWNPATSAYVVASRSIALGGSAGVNQGDLAVSIGFEAGCNAQVNNAIAIGTRAGRTGQSQDGIAIGRNAADAGQGQSSIAIGTFAAQGTPQHSNSIVISALGGTPLITSNANALYVAPVRSNVGASAVYYDSTTKEMTYGPTVSAGISIPSGAYFGDYLYWNSNSNAYLVGSPNITLGRNAGQTTQGTNAVALGNHAGNTNQRSDAVSIGNHNDGVYIQSNQGASAVSIGRMTGTVSQGTQGIAIGDAAGYTNQGVSAVAIGANAGLSGQLTRSIAIGQTSGYLNQGSDSIAIGNSAGNISQGNTSTAIGYAAGSSSQGSNAIAIGYLAGETNQHANTIVLNAVNGTLNTVSGNAFYVAPIRTETSTSGFFGLAYNDTAKEIVKISNAVQTISLGTGLSNSGTAQNPIINVTSTGGITIPLTSRYDTFIGSNVGVFTANATLFTYAVPSSWKPASSGVNIINVTSTFSIKCYDDNAGNLGKDGGGTFITYATPTGLSTISSGTILLDNGGLKASQKNMPCTVNAQLVRDVHWNSNTNSFQCDFRGLFGINYAINSRETTGDTYPYWVFVTLIN